MTKTEEAPRKSKEGFRESKETLPETEEASSKSTQAFWKSKETMGETEETTPCVSLLLARLAAARCQTRTVITRWHPFALQFYAVFYASGITFPSLSGH